MRNWINLVENYDNVEEFYHGSKNHLEIGTVLEARGDGCGEEIEELLEQYRPARSFNRKSCVYMVGDMRTLDTVLPDYTYVYVVEPNSDVQRYDAIWLDRLFSGFSGIDNGFAFPEEDQRRIVEGYWSGQPCPRMPGEQVSWEYLCHSATVVEEISY